MNSIHHFIKCPKVAYRPLDNLNSKTMTPLKNHGAVLQLIRRPISRTQLSEQRAAVRFSQAIHVSNANLVPIAPVGFVSHVYEYLLALSFPKKTW